GRNDGWGMVRRRRLRVDAARRRRCLVEHRSRQRRNRIRAKRSWLDRLAQRSAQGAQHRCRLEMVHRRVRDRLRGFFRERILSPANACAAAPHDVAAGRPGPRGHAAHRHSFHSLTGHAMRYVVLVFLLFNIAPVSAAEVNVTVEIPRIDASEYHRPYVAVWIENADKSVAANLAVWYQQKETSEGAGTKWLADLRQWWRRSG